MNTYQKRRYKIIHKKKIFLDTSFHPNNILTASTPIAYTNAVNHKPAGVKLGILYQHFRNVTPSASTHVHLQSIRRNSTTSFTFLSHTPEIIKYSKYFPLPYTTENSPTKPPAQPFHPKLPV